MFNPQKVYDLLDERKIKHKELLDFLNKNHNGSLKQLLGADIKASNLEKISEFFGLSIDYFFDREINSPGVTVGGTRNRVHHFHVGNDMGDVKTLWALIDEKEKRIKTLEEMIDILKSNRS